MPAASTPSWRRPNAHRLLALCLLVWCASSRARADDAGLDLMQETIPFTDVIDAADGDDRFDISAHVGFVREAMRGTIRRQRGSRTRAVADTESTRSELTFGLDIGLFKDLMATFRMPLVLSYDQALRRPSGRDAADVQADLSDPTGDGSGDVALFDLGSTLRSPTRAGLDYVGLGVAWGVLNQNRDPDLPTLVLLVEGRLAVGPVMHPCVGDGDARVCGNEGTGGFKGEPGSSHGTNGLRVETRFSHRYRYAEPYGSIGMLVRWPSKRGKAMYRPVGDVRSYIHRMPSQTVTTQLGTVFIPWENRAQFQRVGIDVQLRGDYITEGHEFTALFDALGTSSHPHLATPVPEGNLTEDPSLDSSGFNGMTDVQGHFRYGFNLGVEVRAAEYVRFQLGSRLSWVTNHALTSADACNPRVSASASDARSAGCASGVINPHHRSVIDLPGRRFVMTDQFIYDVHFAATASF